MKRKFVAVLFCVLVSVAIGLSVSKFGGKEEASGPAVMSKEVVGVRMFLSRGDDGVRILFFQNNNNCPVCLRVSDRDGWCVDDYIEPGGHCSLPHLHGATFYVLFPRIGWADDVAVWWEPVACWSPYG